MTWYPEFLKEFKIVSCFDLLLEYLEEGRITLDKSRHPMRVSYHDPCNYARKSLKTFGQGYFEEGRRITRACCEDYHEMYPNRGDQYCCGGGGGAWAMSFAMERVYYGRKKAAQVREAGTELLITPCHNCRDQIMKSINKEYQLDIEVKYLWELVADSLVMPGQE